MAYARVVNMEYKSIEDLEQAIKRWADISIQKTLGFPEALSRTVLRTGPTSCINVAVYETEERAEKARQLLNQYNDETSAFHEIIDFHGEVIHQE